ncbi:MAG: formimidoylglutamase [Gammaproteobacteria bacterium RIFCSPHIGHO2_12_FULL_38_14]|nr:MAG: formimidoylglutamase [Gammaproteobacteria bacterium RIFCSPHIGHO2_12_FULL_38_14]
MSFESCYAPPDPLVWQGYADVLPHAYFYQHIQSVDLTLHSINKTADITFALLGFKCDEGIQRDLGRAGAFEGPTAIRQYLAKLPIHNLDIHCYDIGNIICQDHDLEKSQEALSEIIALLLKKNIRVMLMGGGHELAFGHYLGMKKVYPAEKKIGIINFDTHFDLHLLGPSHKGSSKTTFYQIAEDHRKTQRRFDYNCIGIQHTRNSRQLFETAKEYKTQFILADDLHQGLQEKSFNFIDRVVDENDMIYVSLSLDVFSSAFAPGVSATQPLGLNPWHVIPLLRQVAASGKVMGYDIAELAPRYDIDHRTAKLAAMLVYEIIHHHHEHYKIS